MLVEILGKVGGKGNSEVDKVIAKGVSVSFLSFCSSPDTKHATFIAEKNR